MNVRFQIQDQIGSLSCNGKVLVKNLNVFVAYVERFWAPKQIAVVRDLIYFQESFSFQLRRKYSICSYDRLPASVKTILRYGERVIALDWIIKNF